MEANRFAKMLSDKGIMDLKKMQYKYSVQDVEELISVLKDTLYQELEISDFNGSSLVYLENVTQVHMKTLRLFVSAQSGGAFGLKSMEDEIHSTMAIESIDTTRESIRQILNGFAPKNEGENRIYGLKQGLDFISDPANTITEENLYKLYQLSIGKYLKKDDQLLPGNYYRHDSVYITGDRIIHSGLPHQKLSAYMNQFISFIGSEHQMNDLIKASVIHFYLAYLHPYFDGNGRLARLLHLWYLVQRGYPAALFVSLSTYIEKSKKDYYQAYTLVENNAKISKVIDVTPFVGYFVENVYNKLKVLSIENDVLKIYQNAMSNGKVTEKELKLWNFVLSAYGENEFSTKQLERDFSDAAYATIRGFVLKFEELGLFSSQKYGNRVKYRLKTKIS
ncbi:MAG: Fic family protein [Eubacteriaceae bacterium]|nr:Fic family protein [Eubacteriaceae bacterium]